jgi:hypothetical protein
MTANSLANLSSVSSAGVSSDWVNRSFDVVSTVKKMSTEEFNRSITERISTSCSCLRMHSRSPGLEVYFTDLKMTKLESDHRDEFREELIKLSIPDLQEILQNHLLKSRRLKETAANCRDVDNICKFKANWLIVEEVCKAISIIKTRYNLPR